jgi:hypothetical protein
MARSGKYGKIDIPGIGEEEPVFILRAQDRLAAPVIEMYKVLADSHDARVAESLMEEIQSFKVWHGIRKIPD